MAKEIIALSVYEVQGGYISIFTLLFLFLFGILMVYIFVSQEFVTHEDLNNQNQEILNSVSIIINKIDQLDAHINSRH